MWVYVKSIPKKSSLKVKVLTVMTIQSNQKKLKIKNNVNDEKSYKDLLKYSLNSTIKTVVSQVNTRISEQFGLYKDFKTVIFWYFLNWGYWNSRWGVFSANSLNTPLPPTTKVLCEMSLGKIFLYDFSSHKIWIKLFKWFPSFCVINTAIYVIVLSFVLYNDNK